MTLYFTRFTLSTSQLWRLAMVFKVTHLNIRKILEIINSFEWWGLKWTIILSSGANYFKIYNNNIHLRGCIRWSVLFCSIRESNWVCQELIGLVFDPYLATSSSILSAMLNIPSWCCFSSSQWAFGVTLWELMTLGQTPYVDIDPFEMAAYLKDGYRIAQPINCPDEL